MPDQVWHYLQPSSEKCLYIDATTGEGGHSALFLSRSKTLRAVCVDADLHILEVAKQRLTVYGERVRFFHAWFNNFFKNYPLGEERPDRILFDLGISSYHYENSLRGFSFQKDEKLDMRLHQDLELSAADIVNNYPAKELADIIYEYGEERYSRKIASAIIRAREGGDILSTMELRDIVASAVPPEYRHRRIHPSTKTFQALRIAVNGELARLTSALDDAYEKLSPGGRIGVISFHSLEDRIVKRFFREKSRSCTCPPEWPQCRCGGVQRAVILTKKPVEAEVEEVVDNPRGRSARFRVLEKLQDEDF